MSRASTTTGSCESRTRPRPRRWTLSPSAAATTAAPRCSGTASENAGFTTGTPWIGIADNYKAINAAAEVDDPDSVRSFYKMLVHLRKKKMPVISEGKIEFLYPDNADLLAYRRYGAEDGEELLVLCNLTEHDAPCQAPASRAGPTPRKLLGNYPRHRRCPLRPYECVSAEKVKAAVLSFHYWELTVSFAIVTS